MQISDAHDPSVLADTQISWIHAVSMKYPGNQQRLWKSKIERVN